MFCPELGPEKGGFPDCPPAFCTHLEIGKCPRQGSAGRQLSFGSGIFVIIREIQTMVLLGAAVEGKESSKLF